MTSLQDKTCMLIPLKNGNKAYEMMFDINSTVQKSYFLDGEKEITF